MECRQDLQVIIPELESCLEEIAAAGKQLSAHQHRRQQDIWMLVKVAVSSVCTLCGEEGKNCMMPWWQGVVYSRRVFTLGNITETFYFAFLVAVIPEGHSATSKGRSHYCVENFNGDWNVHIHACFHACMPSHSPPTPTHTHTPTPTLTHHDTCTHHTHMSTHTNVQREREIDKTMSLTRWPFFYINFFITSFNVSGSNHTHLGGGAWVESWVH